MELNGWQRIGLVASLLWALGGGWYERERQTQQASRIYMVSVTDLCPSIPDEAATPENLINNSRNVAYFKCLNDASKRYESQRALDSGAIRNILMFSLLPIPLAWLLVYLGLRTYRWIRVGFAAGAPVVESSPNPQTKPRDQETDITPIDHEIEPTTVVQGQFPSFWVVLISLLVAVALTANKLIGQSSGVFPLFSLSTSLPLMAEHPQAIREYLAEAIGMVFVIPLIHLAIASLFKKMRNSTSRRRIFMGWSIVGILAAFFI